MDRFNLQGKIYYQQMRKCGKDNCRICREGNGHGPYWYVRDKTSGQVKYIGKSLPSTVERALEFYKLHRAEIVRMRERLRDELRAVEKLLAHMELTSEECAIIRTLGFGDALVSRTEVG